MRLRAPRTLIAVTVVLAVVLLGAATRAGAADLVVYYPDGPQDPSKMVAAFGPLQAAAKKSGLELNGHYFVQFADFQKFLETSKPAFGLLDAVYAFDNLEKSGLRALAVAQDASGARTQPYCLLVTASKPWSRLEEAKGARLAQTPLAGRFPYLVTEFLLEGALPADHFQAKPVPHAASAINAVELDEADAAFVPCPGVPKANKKLKLLFTTRPLPLPVLVAFQGAPAQEAEKVAALFAALDKGSPLLQTLGFGNFAPASADHLKTLAVYRENPVPSFEDLRINKTEGSTSNVVPSGILSKDPLPEMRARLLSPDSP